MHLRDPEQIIFSLYHKYSTREDNLINAERLFIAASVVRWVFRTASRGDEILQYLLQVEKYLEGEINLYWEGDIIKVGRMKRGK